MLLIYGARYKPDAYRAKIQRVEKYTRAACGPRSRRDVDEAEPEEGGSSAVDALKPAETGSGQKRVDALKPRCRYPLKRNPGSVEWEA